MSPARTSRTTATIVMDNHDTVFKAKGEVLQFDGFLAVYGGGKDDSILPNLRR